MTDIQSILLFIPILIISFLLLYLLRSKETGGNVMKKYTETSSVNGTSYFVEVFQKLFVDGGTIESDRRIVTFEVTEQEYEKINVLDKVVILKKTREVTLCESPEIIMVEDKPTYFIDYCGDRMNISNFKQGKVFRQYF